VPSILSIDEAGTASSSAGCEESHVGAGVRLVDRICHDDERLWADFIEVPVSSKSMRRARCSRAVSDLRLFLEAGLEDIDVLEDLDWLGRLWCADDDSECGGDIEEAMAERQAAVKES
jgi:hypothetical protein